MTRKQDAERQEAIAMFTDPDYGDPLQPGDTLYTICRSVSRSGMSATYSVYRIAHDRDGKEYMQYLTYRVAKATGHRLQRHPVGGNDVIRMDGCGYDRAYQIVYDLSRAVFGDGYALKQSAL